ncbi:SMC family ATPase [Jeotgalibacillus sp. S-D1]|uniref:AAA family ATPase n=1 Tax=Jeotgalibacillus sp. S-D1 TaxID=2552189 RepID=UPI001059BB51|nr:SMC family ATPase [Jeotgalibacillus sp. S-D1]TDL34943.1 SMC family ATPase [Jeotgalibacillus sp. S-D1]
MKPIELKMQAFGPYAKVETIDFRQLENRTMFVISGKTGSGKTTIFDGIAFAIYGKTSGEERTGTDLRSQFADPFLPTEVSLEFSLKNSIYKIIRSPQQEKRKARGDGYTTINTKAELYAVIDGKEQLLAGNVREVEEKIREIMQLDFHQFKQILMIPQGEFRKLLTSDSKDKEQILQKLFHTDIYTKFQEQLKDEAVSLRNNVIHARQERYKWIGSIEPLDEKELQDLLLEETLQENKLISLAKNLVATQSNEKSKIENNLLINRSKKDRLIQEIERASYIHKAFKQLEELKETYNYLTSQLDKVSQLKNKKERAKKAEKIWPAKIDFDERKQLVNKRESDIESFKNTKVIAQENLEKGMNELQELKNAKEEYEAQKQELREMSVLEKKITEKTEIEKWLSSIQSEGIKEKKSLNEFEENKEKLLKKLSDIGQKTAALQDAKVKLSEQKQLVESSRYRLQTINRAVRLDQQIFSQKENLVQIEKHQQQLESKVDQATETKKRLDQQYMASQALYLSHNLKPGEPCAVCGSTDHPNPIREEVHSVSEDEAAKGAQDLQTAVLERDRLLLELKQKNERLSELMQDKEELTVELERGHLSFKWNQLSHLHNKLSQNIKEIEENIGKMTQAISEEQMLNSKKEELDRDLAAVEEQIGLMTISVQRKREQYVEMNGQLKRLKTDIPEKYLDKDFYQQQIKTITSSIQHYENRLAQTEEKVFGLKEQLSAITHRLHQTIEECEKEKGRAEEAGQKWENVMKESLFTSESQVVESLLNDKQLSEIEQQLTEFEKKYYATEQQLEVKTLELKDQDKPEIAVLENQLKEADQLINELETEYQKVSSYIERHETLFERMEENIKETKKLEEDYELVGHLSDMANGKNHLRITFERYVLAFYLEDILTIANERLSKMTSGRYQLLRKEDKSKGNAQGGLELLVFDQYTGQERHVKTLSGGEAFKASLSLALGLADVVQSHAGGVSLETMFIDEGFGTLDPESLDQAIESLMDIQSSGRLVGVISHVPELKERIDARLEVESTKAGSTSSFYFTA